MSGTDRRTSWKCSGKPVQGLNVLIGAKVRPGEELDGLDLSQHGEQIELFSYRPLNF